jgi:hypothetical protein
VKLDPGTHKGMQLVLALKLGVTQRQEELIQNLMQSQQYIISMMQVTIFKDALFPISNNIA